MQFVKTVYLLFFIVPCPCTGGFTLPCVCGCGRDPFTEGGVVFDDDFVGGAGFYEDLDIDSKMSVASAVFSAVLIAQVVKIAFWDPSQTPYRYGFMITNYFD